MVGFVAIYGCLIGLTVTEPKSKNLPLSLGLVLLAVKGVFILGLAAGIDWVLCGFLALLSSILGSVIQFQVA